MGLIAFFVIIAIFLGIAILIFMLMRRNPKVDVSGLVDRDGVDRKHAVAVDDEGRPVMASDAEDASEPRDAAAFEDVLSEELKDLRG